MTNTDQPDARTWRLFGVLLVLLMASTFWSISSTNQRIDQLREQQIEAADFQQKIVEIKSMQRRPKMAALKIEPPDQTGRRITEAMTTANIPPSAMRSTTPMATTRIDRSPYEQRRTTVRLDGLTMAKTLAFCDSVVDQETALTVSDLRFFDPSDASANGSAERWNVELTLTQIIYSPIAERVR